MSAETELREDIAAHREELAATVDALAQKLDVRARAGARLREVRPVVLQALGASALLMAAVSLIRRSRP
ncbi:MAG TPA: DUF3618 domain-containing protein [Mycobacteriales bacterium]|nr:DUF3618 domain-containing protein [Mycobacteriales bacterium]